MAVKTSRISSIKPVKKFYSLIWFFFFFLAALGLSFSLWGLVPWPEIKFRPAALGAWSLSHWTNREVSPWFDSWYSSTFKRPKLGIKTGQFSRSAVSDQLFATPWTAARQAPLSITNPRSPPKPMSIELGMPSNHLILCHPLLLLPSIFPSIRVFSNESVLCITWSKYWSFSISPSNEYSGLISFRTEWFDLPAVQGTVKESSPTLQFKSINSSAFSFLYGTTLTSIHDYWKKHSFDWVDLCGKSNVSAFSYAA